MDRLVVETDVYASPEAVYEFLLDFPRYQRYTEYLDTVDRTSGDGGAGSEYALSFSWWKLSYTAHSRVTDVTPPERIDWAITRDIDARGSWEVEPYDDPPSDAPADTETACRVRMVVAFDPDSADSDAVSLPLTVSFGWVLDKLTGLVEEEATRVVRRAVRDLEGDARDVTLDVSVDSEAL